MNNKGRGAAFFILFICAMFMMLFIYGLVRVSLQDGESSSRITQAIIMRVGAAVFDDELTPDQVQALNLFLRSMAHFFLFSFLAYGLSALAFLFFTSKAGRAVGLIINMTVCAALAYYTEYYKQFVDGRHFQMEDAWLNLYGVILGLCSFMITGFIFWGIGIRSRKKQKPQDERY